MTPKPPRSQRSLTRAAVAAVLAALGVCLGISVEDLAQHAGHAATSDSSARGTVTSRTAS